MSDAIPDLSLHELQQKLREHRVSAVELVDSCLDRIAATNDRLNAVALVLADQARAEAILAYKEIRGGRLRGPLHGIPIGVKDFYDTAGIRTTAAFAPFKDRIPRADAVRHGHLPTMS